MHNDVEEILSRGVNTFIDPEGGFKNKLLKKVGGEYSKDIIIKHGVDPTRPDIHLGHAVILRKLRQLQDLGCKVVFLVGDFTARIGDPSGKSKVRPELEQAEVDHNAKTYIEQVGKILRTEPEIFSWIRNSDWFTNVTDLNLPDDYKIDMDVAVDGKTAKIKIAPNSFVGKAIVFEQTRMQVRDLGIKDRVSVITLLNVLWGLRHITHSRLIGRDMFQERIKAGEELYMHEMMYPVLQGIDSFVLSQVYGSCDLEIGGTDQTFNMLMGRDIMKNHKIEEQAVMALEILPGLDGKEKMSKSLDNYIAITDAPSEMFGKVMSIPDSALVTYFKLATYTPSLEIKEIEEKLGSAKHNPRDVKARLAHEIVAIYHGKVAAEEAENDFSETFSKRGVPKEMESVKAKGGDKLSEIMISQGVVSSKTEWRTLVKEGAVSNIETGEKIKSPDEVVSGGLTLKVGKHRFLRIEIL
ncbi:MAG: tyrosine--tRNA ligase [bacterium]|nr:tyrosine--tRNA ligase [bacterium]